jgi:NlpC/P60 family putative phage cell wall peptidase
MNLVDSLVEEIRTWKETPWHHQASLKGVGTDCVGLLLGTYQNVTGKKIPYALDYHRLPLPGRENRIRDELLKYCYEVPVEDVQKGDVLLFTFISNGANHVGLYTEENQFIHAWQDVNSVVEIKFTAEWKRMLKGVFRLKALEE